MYILYLRHEDAIFTIVCTGLSITTTIAGDWLNSLIFHDDIKCDTDNGYTIIYVRAIILYECQVLMIHFAQKNLGSAESFLIYTYGFALHHMIGVTVCLYSFTVII